MKAIFSPTSTVNVPTSKAAGPWPSFEFFPLSRVLCAAGALDRLGEMALGLGGRRPLLVTDPGRAVTGHPRRALASLRAAGLEAAVFDGVEENPTSLHVAAGVQAARIHGADLLVAVGGGSSLDVAKGINFLLTNGGRMADYKGFGRATQPMLPSIGVPTTSGTGSEAQSYTLIADERSHLKMACGDRKAAFRVVILDPELTVTQPEHVTAVTGLDALTHAIESYVTTRRNPLSEAYSREAWRLLDGHFETVLRHPDDRNARAAMQLGAYLAGCAIEHSMLGAAHSCANPLTAHYGLTHGLAVGIMLPHVIRFNAPIVGNLYADMTHDVGLPNGDEHSAAEVLAGRLTSLMHRAGLPTTLAGCGVSPGIFPVLAEEAAQQWTVRFNPRPATENDLLGLYEAALQ
jgi:alcohol dehydrogenase